MRTIVQSGDGEKNVHSKFDKYKNNTLVFYKTSSRCACSGLLTAPSKAHCRFRFKNIKVYFFKMYRMGTEKKMYISNLINVKIVF